MKRIYLSLVFFSFICANSQVLDSLKKMEEWRISDESFFGNMKGKILPGFTAKDLSGITYSNSTVSSKKVTFINFWFVSCAPCIAEIPNLNRLYDLMKDSPGFQFFAITRESEGDAKNAIKKYDIDFPVLLTSPKEAQRLTFGRGYPTSMVLDKKGRVRSILSGGSLNPGSEFELYWKLEIEKILREDSLVEIPKPVQIPDDNPNIVFIDPLLKIQSLDLLANHFKEQLIYIDLWASWCLPCLQEFNLKNNSVDSFLSKHKVARVFISIDNPKASEGWKNLIYKYQLTGYHLLAGNELIADLKQKIYKNESINIPRYLIVKNGKIVEFNAFWPSDDQKLLKQLTEKLLLNFCLIK